MRACSGAGRRRTGPGRRPSGASSASRRSSRCHDPIHSARHAATTAFRTAAARRHGPRRRRGRPLASPAAGGRHARGVRCAGRGGVILIRCVSDRRGRRHVLCRRPGPCSPPTSMRHLAAGRATPATPAPSAAGAPKAVIVPHAGYVYSGPIAGHRLRAARRHAAPASSASCCSDRRTACACTASRPAPPTPSPPRSAHVAARPRRAGERCVDAAGRALGRRARTPSTASRCSCHSCSASCRPLHARSARGRRRHARRGRRGARRRSGAARRRWSWSAPTSATTTTTAPPAASTPRPARRSKRSSPSRLDVESACGRIPIGGLLLAAGAATACARTARPAQLRRHRRPARRGRRLCRVRVQLRSAGSVRSVGSRAARLRRGAARPAVSFPSSARPGSAPCRSSSARRPRRRARAGRSRSSIARRCSALNASVSCESIDVPDGQPWIDRRLLISGSGGTASGSAAAPRTISVPLTPRPPSARAHRLAARSRSRG